MSTQMKKISEVAAFVRGPFGGSLKKSIFVKSGYAVYEQSHAINNQFQNIRYFIDEEKYNEMKRFQLQPGDIIMSCSGTIGKVAIVPPNISPGVINQALLKITPSECILPKYLLHLISSHGFQSSLIERTAGAAIKNVMSVKILKEVKIFVPSLEEQKRIVAILDKVNEIKHHSENSKPLRKQLIQSVFLEMFGDPILNPMSLDKVPLLEATIGKKKGMIRGPFGGSLKKSMFVEQGYKVYQQGNAIRNDFTYGDYFITKDKFLEMSRFAVAENDLIISCSGTKGKIAIIPPRFEPGVINQALMMLKINSNFSPLFLKYQLESERLHRILFGEVRGSGISNVAPMNTFREQEILAPPLVQQLEFENRIREITALFDSIDYGVEQKTELASSTIQLLIS